MTCKWHVHVKWDEYIYIYTIIYMNGPEWHLTLESYGSKLGTQWDGLGPMIWYNIPDWKKQPTTGVPWHHVRLTSQHLPRASSEFYWPTLMTLGATRGMWRICHWDAAASPSVARGEGFHTDSSCRSTCFHWFCRKIFKKMTWSIGHDWSMFGCNPSPRLASAVALSHLQPTTVETTATGKVMMRSYLCEVGSLCFNPRFW